jgi:hypothetical protein
MRKAIATGIALLVPAALAFAVSPPPPRAASDAITVAPRMAKDHVRDLRLGEFTAHFEKTPLEEIRAKLGGNAISHAGDASESIRWLCYSLPGQILWLISNPMGGTDAHLMQVVAESVQSSDPRLQSCSPVPQTLRPVSLEFGWLGTSEAELHQKLGQPSGVRGDWQLFFFRSKANGPYQAPGAETPSNVEYDVLAYVEAKLEHGAISGLRASHVTSY